MWVWGQVWGLSGKWSMVMWCSAFGPVLLVLLVALAVRTHAPSPCPMLFAASAWRRFAFIDVMSCGRRRLLWG